MSHLEHQNQKIGQMECHGGDHLIFLQKLPTSTKPITVPSRPAKHLPVIVRSVAAVARSLEVGLDPHGRSQKRLATRPGKTCLTPCCTMLTNWKLIDG